MDILNLIINMLYIRIIISCTYYTIHNYRASIKVKNSVPPVIDNVTGDTCRAIAVRDSYHISFEKDQVWNCGVVDCSTDDNRSYCLDLRFPVISGLRLKDDHRVTLRCKTQNRIAYHTRQISVKTLEA